MKFSIVTPTFNSARYLAETIASVVSQEGDFSVEYIVVDNMSGDATVDIVESWRSRVHREKKCRGAFELRLLRQPDSGMYQAINRGFASASGDIYAWINSDDLYLPGAFAAMAAAFRLGTHIRWVKGITAYIDEAGRLLSPGRCLLYSRELLRQGVHGREAHFVQQDSVFWCAEMWRVAGGLDESFRLAGDYDLWMKFARYAPLYALNRPVSCFRRVRGQLSEGLPDYRAEQARVRRDLGPRVALLARAYAAVAGVAPLWLSSLLFRVMCPGETLCYLDGDNAALEIKSSFRCLV